MLPRTRRLSTETLKGMQNNDEVRVTHSSFFTLRTLPSEEPPTRWAVIISKKVAGSAVERHRIKRQVHSIIEDLLPRTRNGWKIALYAKTPVKDSSLEDLRRDLSRALKKAGVSTS